MIVREVLLTDEAERDIEEIYDYIVRHDSVASAEHVVRGLENCWAKLETFAERGNYPKEMAEQGRRDCRELHWKPYRIIYRVLPKLVAVYAIVDGRRDMRAFIQQRFRD